MELSLSTSIDAVGCSWVSKSLGLLLLLLLLSVGMLRLFEKGGVEEEGSNGMLVDGDVACGMPGWTDGVVCWIFVVDGDVGVVDAPLRTEGESLGDTLSLLCGYCYI